MFSPTIGKYLSCFVDSAMSKNKIVGSKRFDELIGTDGRDIVKAKGGDDVITTFGGKDKIKAGNGDDIITSGEGKDKVCLLYTSPSPRDSALSRMPSSA